MGIGSTGGKKPTSHIPLLPELREQLWRGRRYVCGLELSAGAEPAGHSGQRPCLCEDRFSQGAQKISRRHCEVMFNSQVQKYRVTDFSSNCTYVNGSRLPANSPVLLTRGTELALGDNNNIIRLS
ncbi:MAG: FHA domain-containing protein [Gallintestinimicrobium sp.]